MIIKADLKCKQTDFNLPKCSIEKAVHLTAAEFTAFVSEPLGYYDFLRDFNAERHEYRTDSMDNARFVNTDLHGAELNFSVANDTRFESCNLEDVTAEECEFKNTVFSKCKMSGGTYTHSDLSDAVMIECKMEYGSFQNCCTDGTNFCGLDDYAEINMRGCCDDREDWHRESFRQELSM